MGFYLLFRFDGTGEFNEVPDFRKNETWFDKKVLVELGHNTNKKMMQHTFMNTVKEMFQMLGICVKHLAHWGRVTAPVYMEFKELPENVIKMLGKFFFSFCFVVCLIVDSLFYCFYRKLGQRCPGILLFRESSARRTSRNGRIQQRRRVLLTKGSS